MVHLDDWSKGDEEEWLTEPGVYMAEVASAKEKTSSTGNPMIAVTLVAAHFKKRPLCMDYIMLRGKGWGLGKKKLEALGVEPGTKEISPGELVGRRTYVVLVEDVYDGKKKLKPDILATEYKGYYAQGEEPVDIYPQPDVLDMGDDENLDSDVPF